MAEADDRVLRSTRALSIVIIPFLVVAFVVLCVFPKRTAEFFAWPIRPPITAMVLGSVYLGGAYFFLRAARATRWHHIKAGFLPVATFASLMGVATVLHWDKFTHDHVAFWLWAGLYFTTPFLVFAVWAANRRYDDAAAEADVVLPVGARVAIGAIGALALTTGLFLFLAPTLVNGWWPWPLTPLTARVMGAIFALGMGGVLVVTDARWSSARLIVEMQGVMLTLIFVSGFRSTDDLDTSRPLAWLLPAGLTATLVGGALLYTTMNRRPAQSTA